MTSFPFRFRFWHPISQSYVNTIEGNYAIRADGVILRIYERLDGDGGGWHVDLPTLKPEPATGFVSAQPKGDVYLNDIVRFQYQVGDLAWDAMEPSEIAYQRHMSGRTFVGQVIWTIGRFEVECPLSPGDKAPALLFGASYLGGAEVLGNTNQDPDWREKWLPDYGWMKEGR